MALIVFDFDCSLVPEDTDRLIFQNTVPSYLDEASKLYTDETSEYYQQWGMVIGYYVSLLMTEHHITLERINEILYTMPIDINIISSIKSAAKSGATLIIISDANEYYIRTILNHLGIEQLFAKVYSNYAMIIEDRLSITSYQSRNNPHQCTRCPKNLCKGKVLMEFLQQSGSNYHPILYIGDGGGDYCPTTLLTNENDIILCRQDWSLHRRLLSSPPSGAKIIPWIDGIGVRKIFESVFGHIDD